MWIVLIGLQSAFLLSSVYHSQRVGTWSWPLFGKALMFVALEWGVLMTPMVLINVRSRYFPLGMSAGVAVFSVISSGF